MAPSSTMGAVIPLNLSAPTKVVVFQCPWGTGARRRWPRRARPQRRAILVDAPVSSTKTSLSGSRAGWASNQARRRCSTSGRCCLLACADFLEGDAAAEEEAPHGALGDPQPMLALQMGRDLRQHHVRGLFDQRQDRLGPCLDPLRAPVAALRSGADSCPFRLPGPNPLDRRRRRDPEALGRSPRPRPGPWPLHAGVSDNRLLLRPALCEARA